MQGKTLATLVLAQCLVQALTLLNKSPDLHAPYVVNKLQRDNPNNMGIGMALNNRMVPKAELDPKFWRDQAKEELAKRLSKRVNKNKAKNVIFFLGDGMPFTAITAARILQGQRVGFTGEEQLLSFEKFPYTGLSRTYCTNAQVPDSACTSTAYMCGVKSNVLTLGVNANVDFNNCTASMDASNHLTSIYSWAQAAGKSTGFITTTSLTHASPSGGYAHVANRLWECDADVLFYGQDPATCPDIAQQLVTMQPGKNLDVLMGGGMGKFLPNTVKDLFGNPGERLDGKNLLARWQNSHPNGVVVKNRDQLLRLNVSQVSNIMGLFQSELMQYHLHANDDQPTLAEMTGVALSFLSKNNNGYFIFIEGGLIDYGNHENKLGIALDEILEFDKAIQLARAMTDPADTLIVVTADHGHPLSISGYPERGTDILGLNEMGEDSNGVPYATLNYAVGPQQYQHADGTRINLRGKMKNPDFVAPSYIKQDVGVHGGDDVGVYASGPWDHLFCGVMQQNLLPHMMAYASCIGDGPKMCDKTKS
ncbi:alkaline phosphatase-like [Rhagoletis pomonella]|uniref:alkaline phosphatase-like n=1 Tax=Rhagoletis pomonella TaxID=28610 RepID=UPI00178506D1|nr:alkaline phosphatase-like [Rhagoletis pomonella]